MQGAPSSHYSAFGRTLTSTFALPELLAGHGAAPAWTVIRRQAEPAPLPAGCELTGSEILYDSTRASLYRHASGWRIDVDDTGTFDWQQDRQEISCWLRPEGSEDFLRAHLLGRVLGTVLHDQGDLVLHGSAVAARDGAIAFIGPKGHGKSTLALAAASAGAPLLSDDTLPVSLGDPPLAWPGIGTVRLREDSAERLGIDITEPAREDGKHPAAPPRGTMVAASPVPLAAVYALVPAESIAGGEVVARADLPVSRAVQALLGHTKIGEMLGKSAAPALLARAAVVAGRVPVRALVVTRELARLEDTAATILAWHGGPAPRVTA